MRIVRRALALVTLAVLVLGYGASQWADLQGTEAAISYAKSVDSQPIALAALALLVLIVLFAFIPGDADETPPEHPPQ